MANACVSRPQFVRSRRTFVREASHIRAREPLGQPHDPGADLVRRQMDPRDVSIDVEWSRRPNDVETGVAKTGVALAEIDGARGTDGGVEAESAGRPFALRTRRPPHGAPLRPGPQRGHHERSGWIDE